MTALRLGIIGCGGMEKAHHDGLASLAGRMKVTATADIDLDRAAKAAAALGAEFAVTDYRQMLDHVDAVMLVLPHPLHHPVGMDCLHAGKHVLMEKPLAVTEAQCLELIHTARQVSRVLMTAYCMRFHPLVIRMKELLDQKKYGEVFQLSIWTEQHTQKPPGHWYNTAEGLGGGQLFSHGCHYIDLLLWIMGRPVRGTHLGTNHGTEWMEREGTSNVAMEFAGGALGYHFGTWGARASRLRYTFHAHCTDGLIELNHRAGKLIGLTKAGEELLLETASGKQTQNEVVHFLDCIEHGRSPLTDGPGSIQGLRVIWRLYEAESKGLVADLRGLGLDETWDRPGLDALPVPQQQRPSP